MTTVAVAVGLMVGAGLGTLYGPLWAVAGFVVGGATVAVIVRVRKRWTARQ